MEAPTVGVDLGGTKGLFVCGGRTARFATGPAFGPDDFIARLEAFIDDEPCRPSRIGIAVPGLVDAEGVVVACDVLPLLDGWSPAHMPARVGIEHVAVVNDVRAALIEEMHDAVPGLTAGVVMVGTAVGAAFLAHGAPLLGASGWAGELGYLPLSVDGAVRRLDDLAGGAAIAARRGVGPAELAALARAGEPESLAAIEAAGESLGLGLAAVVNLLNPSRLALGGGVLELPGYWRAAERSAAQHSLPALWRDCRLGRVKAGEQVVALGAVRAEAAQRMPAVPR